MECRLCPRECGADRVNNVGFCGMKRGVRVARAALHQWEEPCISGTDGSRGSGTVFFSGCVMRCIFCQNHDISAGGFGKDISTERLSGRFHMREPEPDITSCPGSLPRPKRKTSPGLTVPRASQPPSSGVGRCVTRSMATRRPSPSRPERIPDPEALTTEWSGPTATGLPKGAASPVAGSIRTGCIVPAPDRASA